MSPIRVQTSSLNSHNQRDKVGSRNQAKELTKKNSQTSIQDKNSKNIVKDTSLINNTRRHLVKSDVSKETSNDTFKDKVGSETLIKTGNCKAIGNRSLQKRHKLVPSYSTNVTPGQPRGKFVERKLAKEVSKFLSSSNDLAVSLAKLSSPGSNDGITGKALDSNVDFPSQGSQSGRWIFQSVGKKVTHMLKFRIATGRRKSDQQTLSHSEREEDLPKSPRFSSFMSAEAQYSLLKGYEDIIVQRLSSQYPEYKWMLKRNKTPHHGIAISDKPDLEHTRWKKVINQPNSSSRKIVETKLHKSEIEYSKITTTSDEISPLRSDGFQETQAKAVTVLSKPSSERVRHSSSADLSPAKDALLSPMENIRRLSLFFPANTCKNKDQMLSAQFDLPAVQNFNQGTITSSSLDYERKIALSYRLETAMDLLDTIKTKHEHALSPRVKTHPDRRVAPVVDFNLWADKWTKEFKSLNRVK